MMNATVLSNRRGRLPLVLVSGLALAFLGVSTALAATGGDWQAMLEVCQRAMAALGVQITPEQMGSMMAGCMGR